MILRLFLFHGTGFLFLYLTFRRYKIFSWKFACRSAIIDITTKQSVQHEYRLLFQ